MSGGWNILLAAPEWILAGTVLTVLVMDARTRFDQKQGLARATWLGLIVATAWVALQGFGLPSGDDITERRKQVTEFLAAETSGSRQTTFADLEAAGAPLGDLVAQSETEARAALTPELNEWAAGKSYAFRGHYGFGYFAFLFKLLFGITALMVLALSETWLRRVDRGHGEFRLLLLMATLGMFFVSSVEDFAALFVSLELITICFYCLTAFKRNDERSVEAGVKYVVLGALASAFLLMGIAFIYGQTGSLMLRSLATTDVADALGHDGGVLVQFGVLLALVGLGFKIAAVPFQVWTPDVYQGASSPVTAFLSMGSKAAGFVLLLKLVRVCLGPGADAGLATALPWLALIALLAGITVLYGNLGAIWQGDVKRLLGYSSIGHAGYVLMGIFAFNEAGFAAVIYYLMAYLFTVLAVFAVVVLVNGVIRSHDLDDYAGLGRRSPFLALVLTCGLLSLAGVPPMAGFFGKFLVFKAVLGKGGGLALTLALVGGAGVVISLYYYLCVVKRLYIDEPNGSMPEGTVFAISRPMKLVLWTCLIGIFALGIFMQPFVALAERAADALVAVR